VPMYPFIYIVAYRLTCYILLPGVSTDVLPSNGHPIVVARLSGKVFTRSLPSNDSICHSILIHLADFHVIWYHYRATGIQSSIKARNYVFAFCTL
jgi:hypothetical protein